MGRLIPAGTGFEWYRHVRIPADEPPPPPAEDDLDVDREIEYAFDTDEPPAGGRGPLGDIEYPGRTQAASCLDPAITGRGDICLRLMASADRRRHGDSFLRASVSYAGGSCSSTRFFAHVD